MQMLVKPVKDIDRVINVDGDKSITHRAIMFNSMAEGSAVIRGALLGEDCMDTIQCMHKLGAKIEIRDKDIYIEGAERFESGKDLYVGNSGTTLRLLSGLLAGSGISVSLSGDESLHRRPVQRVVNPLEQMGAKITTNKGFAPISIKPAKLRGINYHIPVASAQVKSAIMLAALNAEGETVISESVHTRDHSELMLKAMGADIVVENKSIKVKRSRLKAVDFTVPGDISSAAYLMVLGTILKGTKIFLPNIGVNPTRTGVIDVINAAGGKIVCFNKRTVCGEEVADISIESAEIRPFRIEGDIVPRLIDEIPVLAILACFADGQSVIADSQELRVKESDRIATTVDIITRMGGKVTPKPDGMVIEGTGSLLGGEVDSYNDHRIAMSAAIAGLASDYGVLVNGTECADISFPQFFKIVGEICNL